MSLITEIERKAKVSFQQHLDWCGGLRRTTQQSIWQQSEHASPCSPLPGRAACAHQVAPGSDLSAHQTRHRLLVHCTVPGML